MNLTIGILTYNSPKTLKNTLQSYRINCLLDVTDDILCIIQPSITQEEEEVICNEYGIKPLIQTVNSKMAGGIKKIWEHAKYEFVLFLECDFCLSSLKEKTNEILKHSLDLINNNTADIVRLRSLQLPGHQIQYNLYKDTIVAESPFNNLDLSRQLYLVNHYLDEPHKVYPDQIKLLSSKPLIYTMTSQHCVYTNNPHIVKKNIFMDYIFPHIKDGENLESQIDLVWHKCNLNIAVTEGLFTHNRIDGHNQCDCCAQRFGGKSDECTWKCCPSTITGYILF
jgi:hypothetical protein